MLVYFEISVRILLDKKNGVFFRAFETLYTKTLIDHHTTSKNHPYKDGLAEYVV